MLRAELGPHIEALARIEHLNLHGKLLLLFIWFDSQIVGLPNCLLDEFRITAPCTLVSRREIENGSV
eukprot:scaffold11172_cov172-Amphora_coffeaeformis.AAC.13